MAIAIPQIKKLPTWACDRYLGHQHLFAVGAPSCSSKCKIWTRQHWFLLFKQEGPCLRINMCAFIEISRKSRFAFSIRTMLASPSMRMHLGSKRNLIHLYKKMRPPRFYFTISSIRKRAFGQIHTRIRCAFHHVRNVTIRTCSKFCLYASLQPSYQMDSISRVM